MTELADLQAIFRYCLGREMNQTELSNVTPHILTQIRETPVNILAEQVITSSEFIGRHKFRLLPQLIPRRIVVAAPLGRNMEIYVDLRQIYTGWGVLLGNYEPVETAFMQAQLQRGMRVVDVGAHMGYYSLLAAEIVGPGGHVYAFEPVSPNYELLRCSIRRNNLATVITAYQIALSNHSGVINMVYEASSINLGGAHISIEGDTQVMSTQVIQERVECKTLNELLPSERVDFIKMDVEGAEKLVLDGASELIQRSRPTMMLEINRAALKRISGVPASWIFDYAASLEYEVLALEVNTSVDSMQAIDGGRLEQLLSKNQICNVALRPC